MQSITLTCDCGCKTQASKPHEQEGWLILSQRESSRRIVRIPKDLHFVNFDHLAKWTIQAKKVAEGLEKTFDEEPGPHGTISREGCVLII